MRILIIEDNPGIVGNLYDFLTLKNHEVETVSDGSTGLGAAATGGFDAIILDVRLPRMSGFELCRRLRSELKCDTPVLILTALDTLEDKLEGFSAGADDYLVKPFALREVEARLNALVSRRSGRTVRRALRVGELCYDPEAMTISLTGREIKLPPKCIRILTAMMEQPHRTFSRVELERVGWGNEEARAESMRAHISILRRALSQPGQPDPIRTLHGLGYRINPEFVDWPGLTAGGPSGRP